MTALAPETRTYFGDSLDELLPQIREELGADAMIVRQREGIVGGIGGFFGRKCVEVEAQPAITTPVPSVPPKAVVDAYDTNDQFEPLFPDLEPEPEFAWADEPVRKLPQATNGLEAMLARSSPFATTLSSALAAEPAAPPAPRPERNALPETLPSLLLEELKSLHDELVAAAVPVRLAGEIVAEARYALRPFDPDEPMRELVRRSLTRRIPIARARRSGRRRIAVIGAGGAGRTLVTASLCSAYAQTDRSVAAISLEPAREAMQLGELLGHGEIGFEVAHAPDLVARACSSLGSADILVGDLPPLVDAVDPARLATTLELLQAFRPDETHLVLPAGMSAPDGHAILAALAPHRLPTRLIVSHCDDQQPTGVPVGLALAHRIPVSFLSSGASIGRLRPAEPDRLAEMVLQ